MTAALCLHCRRQGRITPCQPTNAVFTLLPSGQLQAWGTCDPCTAEFHARRPALAPLAAAREHLSLPLHERTTA